MHRASLVRKVRASASASATESEFVRRARDTGMLVRPRYAKNTTDVIVGYSVAERPKQGERPIWFGGGTLASDLKLGALREEWMDSPHVATEAATEWNAAARNRRTVSRAGPENGTPPAEMWVEYTRNATALVEQLRTIPRDDHATWAKVARDVSGAFAAWSYRLEPTRGRWRPPLLNCPARPSCVHHGSTANLSLSRPLPVRPCCSWPRRARTRRPRTSTGSMRFRASGRFRPLARTSPSGRSVSGSAYSRANKPQWKDLMP
ncbi:hypothetical protein M2428_001733 [Arthrobacter sp. ES3-54]|nr:hypothetical protein [Arthrobacter sp. ES3-54]